MVVSLQTHQFRLRAYAPAPRWCKIRTQWCSENASVTLLQTWLQFWARNLAPKFGQNLGPEIEPETGAMIWAQKWAHHAVAGGPTSEQGQDQGFSA